MSKAGAPATTTTSDNNAPVPPNLPPFTFDANNGESSSSPQKKRKKSKVKESIIDHTYRDYSQVEVPADDSDDNRKTPSNMNFPAKLHAILSNPSYQHIICWQPHGRAWRIVDKFMLTTVVLPKHFAHAKFESFNRSVNGWGFKRLLNPGLDNKSYYHECFLRGRPDLTKLMQRLTNPGKRLPDKAGEPNFYEISKAYPLPELPPGPMPMGVPPQGQHRPPPQGVPPSPSNAQQPGQPYMMSPPPHAQGYVYPYPQPAYPPMGMQGAKDGQNPPQQQPHMYWQGPPGGSPYQPHPYGYYPYPPPHMMMAAPQGGPGPQGYYMVPYPPPQYYPQNPNAATPDRAPVPGSVGQPGMMPMAGNPAGMPMGMAPGAQNQSGEMNMGNPAGSMVGQPGMMPMGMGPGAQKQSGQEQVNQMMVQASNHTEQEPKAPEPKKKKVEKKNAAPATTIVKQEEPAGVNQVAKVDNVKNQAVGASDSANTTEKPKATEPESKENTNADSTAPVVKEETKADEAEPNVKEGGNGGETGEIASKDAVKEEKKDTNAEQSAVEEKKKDEKTIKTHRYPKRGL